MQILIERFITLPEIWYFKKAHVNFIQRATCEFNWEKAFDNKNSDEKEFPFFNNINKNVLSILNPHPPWFSNEIKNFSLKT